MLRLTSKMNGVRRSTSTSGSITYAHLPPASSSGRISTLLLCCPSSRIHARSRRQKPPQYSLAESQGLSEAYANDGWVDWYTFFGTDQPVTEDMLHSSFSAVQVEEAADQEKKGGS